MPEPKKRKYEADTLLLEQLRLEKRKPRKRKSDTNKTPAKHTDLDDVSSDVVNRIMDRVKKI
ncbi:MAG: hypothetical protein DWQ07_06095 [Chloroflexi bacterium]|nr:MAG: hypothetical protein DWQ07_06095 [Chloroflexota bacterium]MBL1196000.1 hypothetical protein [Chloroflexota bacterium]NOH13294.1 hypothetical protein [Chloroflexota bacterium]